MHQQETASQASCTGQNSKIEGSDLQDDIFVQLLTGPILTRKDRTDFIMWLDIMPTKRYPASIPQSSEAGFPPVWRDNPATPP
jgi:hypothetical protein